MNKLAVVLVVLIEATLAAGCATVTKGSTQVVTLQTEPDGATCDVLRDKKTLASLSATPGQITVDKGWGAIDVCCRKAGHQATEVRVDSQVQAWTFGNILIGGIVGFAVDAASGAMRQYPQLVTMTLVPDEFASVEDRDRYLRERIAVINEDAAKATELLEKKCESDGCVSGRKALEEERNRRVAIVRENIDRARIREAAVSRALPAVPSEHPAATNEPGN